MKNNQLAYQRICYGIMERILIDLVRHSMLEEAAKPAEQTHEPSQFLHPALTYMHHHFREALSLAEVASQVHLSPNYFSERFSEIHGISFQRYLQDLRLQFAYSLLLASVLPITEICYAAGFKTLSHFERVFKQKFGRSPRSFSLALRQNGSSEET
jgi:AraC-like DNA-binding protein